MKITINDLDPNDVQPLDSEAMAKLVGGKKAAPKREEKTSKVNRIAAKRVVKFKAGIGFG